MCGLLILLLTGPRTLILLWWLLAPGRWERAFESVAWPILGFLFLPWTTLMFVVVAPSGNVESGDWPWLLMAFVLDWFTTISGYFLNRGRVRGSYP
jgi:hypothetical protein